MPPKMLYDLASLDQDKVIYDRTQIEAVNPHRFEMQHLDGVLHLDPQEELIVAYKDITDQEFWIRGHIPDRPIMPGVIMVEAAAQMLSFGVNKMYDDQRFIGFGGIDQAKFRGTVTPGCKLIMIGKMLERRPRRYVCQCQGYVKNQMVFEVKITGMAV
jgi:3-hydroxyacyl-[acyl-carrier-protein] dehydratase